MTVPSSPLTFKQLIQLDEVDFVRACYLEVLQREPDEGGLADHVNALHNGATKTAIVASIASSQEACLTGRALAPIAVRARDAAFLESSDWPSWLRWPAIARIARRTQEAVFRGRAQAIQRAARAATSDSFRAPVEVRRIPADDWDRRAASVAEKRRQTPSLWLDLTTAFQWTGGVVGIVRAELELACGFKKIHPEVRFSMQVDQGFVEIDESQLAWLLNASNVAEAYMNFFGRHPGSTSTAGSIEVVAPDREGFIHPFRSGDVVFAAGWMDSQKENYFSLLKSENSEIYLVYLVYDIIMLLPETKHFYPTDGRQRFTKYIEWISVHCDLVLYGGRTAQVDTEAYLKRNGFRIPPGLPVQFGTDIVKAPIGDGARQLLEEMGIKGPFFLTVGSIEPRKNHETLYRAYLMALEAADDLPQLVIVGKPMWRANDLMNILTRDPRLKDRVICLTPTDTELAALYENCLFTLLPSLYEGWSLTLPESLGQGKFCLCSDTPPLREIGGDLVDYVEPFDVKGWSEKLVHYSTNKRLLADRNAAVVARWPQTHWVDTAKMAQDAIFSHVSTNPAVEPRGNVEEQAADSAKTKPTVQWQRPAIWMDITLSFLHWSGGISGIVRAELEFARHLKALRPDTRFFANQMADDYFFEVDSSYLSWLFDADDLTKAYKSFHEFWLPREQAGTGYRNPFFEAHRPIEAHPAYLPSFPSNSVVFFAGIDSDGTGTLRRSKDVEELVDRDRGVMTSQLIYDLTPIKFPQFHTEPTCRGFDVFFERVSNHFDFIVYGGQTAREDGIAIQERLGWKSPPSGFVEFGSDINPARNRPDSDRQFLSDDEILSRLGIASDFVITVGTIEPRKNHEVLYKAYLSLLRDDRLAAPMQMVFVGRPGWNSGDFLATLEDDDRVRGRILILSPTDEQLDVLYRRCLFTLLPSFYEGWSLTLPESLSYGKLCLASSVEPLREVGGDLVRYVHPLDTLGWADAIAELANDKKKLRQLESRIKSDWIARSWRESAQMLLDELDFAHKEKFQRARASVA